MCKRKKKQKQKKQKKKGHIIKPQFENLCVAAQFVVCVHAKFLQTGRSLLQAAADNKLSNTVDLLSTRCVSPVDLIKIFCFSFIHLCTSNRTMTCRFWSKTKFNQEDVNGRTLLHAAIENKMSAFAYRLICEVWVTYQHAWLNDCMHARTKLI